MKAAGIMTSKATTLNQELVWKVGFQWKGFSMNNIQKTNPRGVQRD